MHTDLSQRTRDILRLVVDAYVATGEPVGSKTLSQRMGMSLSPASIRNAMAELEELGLLFSPHTSAGRLPTDAGLSVFVEGLLEISELDENDKKSIERQLEPKSSQSVTDLLEQTSSLLSGLSSCAGLVFAPKSESPVRQIDFVQLSPGRVLAVLVSSSGMIENRLLEVSSDIPPHALTTAANYLNARLANKTLAEASESILHEMRDQKDTLDALTRKVVQSGLACLAPQELGGHLIVRGQANLLEDVTAAQDLARIRALFEALEARETMLKLLQATTTADGVQIFIGARNQLFSHAGCTMIVSPYRGEGNMIGALGVIGPTRMDYGRIIPVINYTSQLMGRLIGT